MSLPSFNTSDRILSMMQSQWAAQLDPVLVNPLVLGRLITGVSLVSGSPNVINTLLGRKLQGWLVVGQSAQADVWDSQAANQMADKTLILNVSAPCTVALWVF